jgi:two-component system CitB family sensor kinase
MSFLRTSLKNRMILALGITGALQTGIIGIFAWVYLTNSLSDQIGQRALKVAHTIAAMPSVIDAVEKEDKLFLNNLSKKLAETNEALFIVIGNRIGIRLAHPNPKKIGKSMADDDGDDNAPSLIEGKGYISKAEGSLGLSMRGKAPIYDHTGKDVIGIISVGYLLDQVQKTVSRYSFVLVLVICLMIFCSILIAIIIASRFKKAIFGLEPEQISQLVEEQDATLQSIREGVIAVNSEGVITTLNKKALETLSIDIKTSAVGLHITEVLPESGMLSILETGEPQFDREIWLNGRAMIVNRLPLRSDSEITGVVSSFRPKNEVDLVSKKLSRIQTLADSLRSQAHEYSNKLHTIAGLIQLGAYEEALNIIGNETAVHQALIGQLMDTIEDPLIAGCLLGKYSRAREMGMLLTLDKDSQIGMISADLPKEQLVSCLGNLIDNALEATLNHTGNGGIISVSMTDIGDDIIFDVEDQGGGIEENDLEHVFEKGYSSKSDDNHGIGLYLVKQFVNQWGGSVTIDSNVGHGSRFTLYLPKIPKATQHEQL